MITNQMLIYGAAAFLVYKFVFQGNVSSIVEKVKAFFAGLKPKKAPVSLTPDAPKPSPEKADVMDIVKEWGEFRDKAEAAGLTDVVAQLDEIWKVLNPKAVR
jgi:hypothetical protein